MNHFKPNYAPSMNKWPEWMWSTILAHLLSEALKEEFGTVWPLGEWHKPIWENT